MNTQIHPPTLAAARQIHTAVLGSSKKADVTASQRHAAFAECEAACLQAYGGTLGSLYGIYDHGRHGPMRVAMARMLSKHPHLQLDVAKVAQCLHTTEVDVRSMYLSAETLMVQRAGSPESMRLLAAGQLLGPVASRAFQML